MPVQERLYKRHCANGPVPEARLYPMMLGSIVLPISLFILAFTSYPGIIWVGPCAAGVLFGFSMVIIYISANSVSVPRRIARWLLTAVYCRFIRQLCRIGHSRQDTHAIFNRCFGSTMDHPALSQSRVSIRRSFPRPDIVCHRTNPLCVLLQGWSGPRKVDKGCESVRRVESMQHL